MEEIQSVLTLYKNQGETPLECIFRFKEANAMYKDRKMTYAGRLDPMAEGLLLVLVGEECKKKEEYLALNKEYFVDVLFGVSTDTGDCLGLIKEVSDKEVFFDKDTLKYFVGKRSQTYPAYSSRTVEGIPLFVWARKGIEKIFKKEVEIFDITYVKEEEISATKLLEKTKARVQKVQGDFRQDEIVKSFEVALGARESDFLLVTLRVSCGSGTYMRVLAEEIGQKLGVPALALEIKRTKVGNYSI